MNSKKAITLLVLATLLMSLLPVLPASAGITDPEVWDLAGGVPNAQVADGVEVVYDDTYTAVGSGVSPGQDIEVYWDLIQAWDGEAGLLNTSKGLKDGTFEVWFDIPEAVNGDHYVWVRDVSTGETVKAVTAEVAPVGAVMVAAYVELDPDSGLEDDEITVHGYGYSAEKELVPTLIEIFGGGLGAPADMDLSPSTPETDEVGSWTATWIVPDDAAYTYDDYDVFAEDEEGVVNPTAAVFTIGSSVTIDVEEGPTGTVVEAEGRGFTPNGDIVEINFWEGSPPVTDTTDCEVTDDDDLEIDNSGEFSLELVIPSDGVTTGDWTIQFIDSGAETTLVEFEVTGLPEIESSPDYGIQGETIVVEGWNFSAIADEEVEVFLREIGGANPESLGTAEVDSDGHFEDEFTIPGIDSDTYEVFVEQTDWNIDNQEQVDDNDANFKVGLMIAIITPSSGPSGTDVHITANGFDGDAYDLNFSDIVIYENQAIPGASVSDDFFVPSLAPGEYTISLKDDGNDGSEIFIETIFEVTMETYVETSPTVAPNEYNVTIMGYGFPDEDYSDLDFLLFNDTHEWTLDPQSMWDWDDNDNTDYTEDDAAVLEDGEFRAYFEVPDDEEISVGTYWINVTSIDDNVWAMYEFQVVEKTVDIEPRKSTFAIQDIVAFDVVSSFKQGDSYIEVYDPEGNLYWRTDEFDLDDWVKVGTVMRYPYYSQIASGNVMELLEDAPLGEWSWTWYDEDDDELDAGTFTVVEAEADLLGEQVADLNNQITDLSNQISDVTSDFDDVKSDIADVAAIAEQAVTAAQQAAEAVETVAQTANTASQAAENAAEAANAARDAANGLTTLVYGAIGAALVAALAAIVSLMQISRRIAG
jgi:hypothetical protein